jgi:Tfp pilus assembly protein PilF
MEMNTATMPAPPQRVAPTSGTIERPQSPWIYRPWIDLVIGCGGWSAPLILLAFYAKGADSHAWTVAFYSLALLLNYPHFMATVYRAYHTHTEFKKYRIFTVYVALVLAVAGVAAHLWYPLLPWIFTLYICWSPWHYTGQNFGLLMMFARRSGLSPTSTERRAIHLCFVASFLLLMLSFHTGTSSDALVLSLAVPARFTLPARAVLALFFIATCGWALISMARRSTPRAILAPFTLAVTQFLWFLLPALIEIFRGSAVPQTRYSSGILAVLHSTQYLWITSYYQEREARAGGGTHWRFSRYLLILIAGGIALFIPGPWIASRLFHADFATSFLTFTALVNIHHFVLDGALWKLRDSRTASLLLNTREKTIGSVVAAQNMFIRTARSLAGASRAARGLRIATVAVLFAWAAVDQLHFYWSSTADNLDALERAAKLNPDDSAVQIRLARAATLAGQRDLSLAALQHAAAVGPGSVSVQEAYARGLIEAGRDTRAYAQYQTILTRWPRNADALVNLGLLAHRLGQDEEALASWQRAVDVDPAQANAQLYLAGALDQSGQGQAAARHYRAYLQIVAAHRSDHRSETTFVLAALIKVADADAAGNRPVEALQGYNAARNFAVKSGDKTLESLASVHLADLEEKQGSVTAAAESYQHALVLDASLSDQRSAASDWVNYGQFLHRQGQPERLIFACFLRAEDLLDTTPGEELSAIIKARRESETRLGRDADVVRRTRATWAGEALSLPASSFSGVR